MARYIRSKEHAPATIKYNAVQTVALGANALTPGQANTVIVQRIPLGQAIKILAVSVVPSGAVAGTAAINLVSGAGAYIQGNVPVTDTRLNFPAIYPSITAQPGQALFAADVPIVMTAEQVQNFYPTLFDAIWPAGSQITLRVATNGAAAGNLTIRLTVVPVDNSGNTNQPFIPGPTTL